MNEAKKLYSQGLEEATYPVTSMKVGTTFALFIGALPGFA